MQLVKKILLCVCLSCFFLVNFSSNGMAFNLLESSQLESIMPEVNGIELLKKVAKEYAPEKTFSYKMARDIMYTKIDNHDGVVQGIYTGYSIDLDPNSSTPRKTAYQNHINAEHIYPQSKGAIGSAKSDLHSLFPAYERINSQRSNNPFAEINDSLTDKWWINNQILLEKPITEIDNYSESLTGSEFEPRENKKGDVARAMFYFYTVYREQANAKDSNFFPEQKEILCQWNIADPVDDAEIIRSHLIATYQGNENPFVIDSTLATRIYCDGNN
ncbi:MAG: endonuclease I [Okeania sp. SIO1H6]|nr:endonuclease I [Okeania sp. SIO1H6]